MSDLGEKELARRRELAWQMAETVMATVKEEDDFGEEYELMATVRPVYLRDDNDTFEVVVCKKPEGEDEFRMSSYSLATVRALHKLFGEVVAAANEGRIQNPWNEDLTQKK